MSAIPSSPPARSAEGAPPDRPLLVIDASSPRSVVAVGLVGQPGPLAADSELAVGGRASEALVPRIEAVMARAGVRMGELVGIAVGRGPGTFTGVRVAVATAKGLALGRGLGLYPFGSLDAVAFAPLPDAAAGTPLLATLDARKGEVYAASYTNRADGPPRPDGPAVVAPLAELLAGLDAAPGPRIATGTGLSAWPESASAGWRVHPCDGIDAPGAWQAAATAAKRPPVDVSSLDVTYLRRSYAELGIHPPRRPFTPSPYL